MAVPSAGRSGSTCWGGATRGDALAMVDQAGAPRYSNNTTAERHSRQMERGEQATARGSTICMASESATTLEESVERGGRDSNWPEDGVQARGQTTVDTSRLVKASGRSLTRGARDTKVRVTWEAARLRPHAEAAPRTHATWLSNHQILTAASVTSDLREITNRREGTRRGAQDGQQHSFAETRAQQCMHPPYSSKSRTEARIGTLT